MHGGAESGSKLPHSKRPVPRCMRGGFSLVAAMVSFAACPRQAGQAGESVRGHVGTMRRRRGIWGAVSGRRPHGGFGWGRGVSE
jgi:hypothetical protein